MNQSIIPAPILKTKKILYLGIDLPSEYHDKEVTHCPLIRIVPRSREDFDIVHTFALFQQFTHIIFTSKNGARVFFEYAAIFGISKEELYQKIFVVVGQKTAQLLKELGMSHVIAANEETAEGVISLLANLNLNECFILWPHSALSRLLISDWLKANQIKFHDCVFYNTVINIPKPLPDITEYDEIVFTSPSIVDAYCTLFGELPKNKLLTCIGPVTQRHLVSRRFERSPM